MGWLILLALGGAAMVALALLGAARALWSMLGAALMLGAAGYALQGSPGLPTSPARPAAQPADDDPGLAILRGQMLGRFTADDAYLVAADAMTRSGDPRAAAAMLIGGLNAMPRSVPLWTALGTTLARHDNDQVSPPALFAFRQAARLSPRQPAPPFFLGLAYVRAGNLAAARAPWARALALSPSDAPYRRPIAERLALLDRYLALAAGR